MIYFKETGNDAVRANPTFKTFAELKAVIEVDIIEQTKAQYDEYIKQTITIPQLSNENEAHQMHQNAETFMSEEMTRYENQLFSIDQARINVIVPLSNIVTYIKHLTPDNKIKYDEFQELRKAYAKIALVRANTLYDAVVNQGLETSKAEELANSKVIPITNKDALQAEIDFNAWLNNEHGELAIYLLNSASLKYASFLTEDEPDADI